MSTADFIARRRVRDFEDSVDKATSNAMEELRERGATFFRASRTAITNEVILEGWKETPKDQGDLPL